MYADYTIEHHRLTAFWLSSRVLRFPAVSSRPLVAASAHVAV